MSKAAAPELKKCVQFKTLSLTSRLLTYSLSFWPILFYLVLRYMDKRLFLELNGNRKVSGVLRGFDPFMNIVLEDATEEVSATDRQDMGMIVIRGNSIVVLEALEKIV
ncbi:hypothetical protein HDU81_007564 [Chytriomyces hyalinus]|nr:hypothetical protein HDU81_007564 [Chytriomyces hyalinus]